VSKKAAEGLAALVLDVKVGKAALLSDETAARQLARLLVLTYTFVIVTSLSVYHGHYLCTTSINKERKCAENYNKRHNKFIF